LSRPFIALVCASLLVSACGRAAGPRPKVTPTPVSTPRTILPAPERAEAGSGAPFTVTPSTVITFEGGDRVGPIAKYLSELIGTAVATLPPSVRAASDPLPSGRIHLALRPGGPSPEGYELTVAPDVVTITASDPAGLFYGVQTLRQLMPWFIEYEAARADRNRPVTIPAAHVVDAPRFVWRGAMLDVSRHFFTVDEVKRYIDLLAMLKMNRLHLHLADDQGWRIEITSWPNLTAHGGTTEVGGGTGGFYTQRQFAELVFYATSRFITIVPEIDMPGHTNAALASYPELNCNGVAPPLYTDTEVGFSALCVEKEITYKFIDDVVREIAAMSPGPYFHVGGDEVKTLTPAQYAAFIERVQGIVQSHGKQMIGWDETAATNLLPSSIVQHWRPKTTPRAAVEKGTKVILSPGDRMYLDMKYDPSITLGLNWAGLIEVRTAYDWDPETLLDGVRGASILGVEAPLWSETIGNIRDLEYLAFPRLAAVAEIGWTRRDARDWDAFRTRLAAQGARWSALGLNFYRSPQVPW
jgi:hexosaminidase